MAHVEDRRKQGRGWRVRYRDPSGRERSRTFARKGEALDFAATVEVDMKKGTWTDPARGKILLKDWAETWVETKVDLRPSSRARLEGILRAHVVSEFGNRPLTGIGNAEIRGWVARLRSEELSASTVRKSFNALSQIMRAAVADRRIPFNPCQDVPLPVEHHVEQRFLTPREVEALAEAIEPRFRALVLLAAYGGLRFGELAGLRRSKLDPVRGRVQIVESLVEANGRLSFGPPKTKRSLRTVPLPRRIVSEIEEHLEQYVVADHDSLVFTGPKGSTTPASWIPPRLVAAGDQSRWAARTQIS